MPILWLLVLLAILAVFYRSRKEIYIVPEGGSENLHKIKPKFVFQNHSPEQILSVIRNKTPSKIAVIANGNGPALAQALHYGTGGLYKIKVLAS